VEGKSRASPEGVTWGDTGNALDQEPYPCKDPVISQNSNFGVEYAIQIY